MNCPNCKAKLPAKYKYFFSFGNIKTCPTCQKNFELSVPWGIYITFIAIFIFAKNYFFPDDFFSTSILNSLVFGLSIGGLLMLSWQAKKIPEDITNG